MTEIKTDHAAEAESYLQGLDGLDAADAYVAVIAAQAHSNLAQLVPAREMVELQRQLLASMLPATPSPTPVEPEVFNRGYEAAQTAFLSMLRSLRAEAITSERKSGYDRAIEAVGEMQP